MKQFNFGRYRKIELFETTAESEGIDVDFVFGFSPFSEYTRGDIHVIGQIDNDLPLLRIKNKPEIYAFTNGANDLLPVCIAGNEEKLVAIIEAVGRAWENDAASVTLKKTDETVALYHEIMEQIKKENPGSDVLFWDDYAFIDLKLGLI